MKGFEKIKRQIEEISYETDSRKGDLEKQIASVKAEIEQADNAMKIAADTKSVDDFQKQQAVSAILVLQLEKLQTEYENIKWHPPITAEEHTAIKTELRKVTKDIVLSKYQDLINLLDKGAEIVAEIEATAKVYYSTFRALDSVIKKSETDVNGTPFRAFSSSDTYEVPRQIREVFCSTPNSIHSIRHFLKHKIDSKQI